MLPLRTSRDSRCGYTLAELLIVMTILVMLMAITLPLTRRVMEDANVREASRELNAYFAMAKSRALQTGRPCGIMMRCDLPLGLSEPAFTAGTLPAWPVKQVTQMYLAEVPPPYAGGLVGSRGRIMQSITASVPPGTYSFYPLTLAGPPYALDTTEMVTLANLLQVGEQFLVRFDYKGPWYICRFVPATTSTPPEFVFQAPGVGIRGATISNESVIPPLTPITSLNGPLPPGAAIPPSPGPPPTSTIAGYSYQIIRMPRRIGNPLSMPNGTCIDVAYSGVGPNGQGFFPAGYVAGVAPVQYITIMFTPGGGIDSVYVNNYPQTPPTTVHFLLGRTDKLNLPTGTNSNHPTNLNLYDPNLSNLADPLSLWVSVGRSTGIVITSENNPPSIDLTTASPSNILMTSGTQQQQLDPTLPVTQGLFLSYCRQLATDRQQVRGQ